MPFDLSTPLFWVAAAAIVVAQVMILRSTARVLRAPKAPGNAPLAVEWSYALLPAVGLVLTMWWSWREVSRPPVIQVEITAQSGPRS